MKQPVFRRAALVAIAFALAAALWSRLPDRMPLHWDLEGDIDRWGSRAEGALLLPLMMLAIWGVGLLAPRIDPRQASYERMRGTYVLVIDLVLAFMLVIHGIVLATALGYDIPVARVIPGLVGVLLVALGNVLPRAKPNWSFGIRTPWTLSSDRVWARTHRVGGYLMALAGLLMVAGAFLPARFSMAVFFVALVPATLGPVLYSYFAWRKETAK